MSFVIAHIAAPQITSGGDFVYRLKQPDAAMGRLPGVVTVSLTNICSRRNELILGADVLVIQLLGDGDLLPVILERRRAGRPTVFEISDNFLHFQPSNPAAAFYEDPDNRACILQLISESDAAQTTMPSIADIFAPYCRRIEVFPNQIETLGDPERADGPFTIGWGGSAGHYEDIAAVAPALIDWLNRRPGARLAIMGDASFRGLFDGAPRDRFSFSPPGSLEDYYRFLSGLHAGIAPLKDDPFNLCRSDVKFIEYASRGVVPVCSDIPTYNMTLRDGETGFLFKNTDEMIGLLDRLADDTGLRRGVGRAAFDYVRTERTENAAARRRLEFYRSLVKPGAAPGTVTEKTLRSIKQLVQTPGAKHFLHSFSDAESNAFNGLVYQFNRGDRDKAEASYRAAVRLEPDFFQAHFYLGNLLLEIDAEAACAEMDRTLEIWPVSCEARRARALALCAAKKNDDALDLIRSARADCALYAPAYSFEADLLPGPGEKDRALELLRGAVEVNPFYTPAMIRLGAHCLTDGDAAGAEKFFRRALEIAPRAANAYYGLAAALQGQDREDEAVDAFIESLRIKPGATDVADVFLNIPLKYYKEKDYEKSIAILSRALDAAPGQVELLFWMARIQERVHGGAAALPFWKRLARADMARKYARFYENMEQ